MHHLPEPDGRPIASGQNVQWTWHRSYIALQAVRGHLFNQEKIVMEGRQRVATSLESARRDDHAGIRASGRVTRMALITMLLATTAAQASGHLPGMPVPPRDFADFAACKAHLQEVHRIDLSTATNKPEEIRPGVTRQMLVETDGVVETGAEQATYSARVGAQIRSRDEERGYIQTNYSYNEKQYVCKGRTLTGTDGGGGYYLPGYEKIETKASP